MAGARQREWLTNILEGLPSLAFIALWRGGAEAELAGWVGTGLAATVLLGFRRFRVPFNPVLLGINLHLLLITPLIEAVFLAGATGLGQLLLGGAVSGVLITVLVVGAALTLLAPRGFIGAEGPTPADCRRYSLVLLAATAAAVPWPLAHAGDVLLAVGVPLLAVFALRRLLLARWRDRTGGTDAGPLGLAAAHAGAAEPAGDIG